MAYRTLGGVVTVTVGLLISACTERALEFTSDAGGAGGEAPAAFGGATSTGPSIGGSIGVGGSVTTTDEVPACLGTELGPDAYCQGIFGLPPRGIGYSIPNGPWPAGMRAEYLAAKTNDGTNYAIYPVASEADCSGSPIGGFYQVNSPESTYIGVCPCTSEALTSQAVVSLAANIAPCPRTSCSGTAVDIDALAASSCSGFAIELESVDGCNYASPPVNPATTMVSVVISDSSGLTQKLPHLSSESECGQSRYGGWFFDDNSNPQNIKLCACSCAAVVNPSVLSFHMGCDVPVVGQPSTPIE